MVEIRKQELIEAEARLASSRKDLARTVITSPMAGIVSSLKAKQGEVVITGTMNNPGTVIMSISDLSKMQVRTRVDEVDVPLVKKGQKARIYLQSDPDRPVPARLRRQLNRAADEYPHVSVHALIVKACAGALARHPIFNTSLVEGAIQAHEQINVCIAIALDDGLIAPAILDCANKNLGQIAEASRSLAERAKSGSLKPEEYTGGTFTVSNLGMFNVESLVAIIQPPQTAILGVGAVRAMPIVRDGKIEPAEMMKVALSADHRVTDGAQGAPFLNEIRRLLEHPAALLVQGIPSPSSLRPILLRSGRMDAAAPRLGRSSSGHGQRVITRHSVSSNAMTLVERGKPSSSAISPNGSPAPFVASSVPPFVTCTLPLTIT